MSFNSPIGEADCPVDASDVPLVANFVEALPFDNGLPDFGCRFSVRHGVYPPLVLCPGWAGDDVECHSPSPLCLTSRSMWSLVGR